MADVAVFTDVGLAKITDLLASISVITPHWVGWGVLAAAAADHEDTALESPGAEARTVGTVSQQTSGGGVTNDTYRIVALITCTGADKIIKEVGVFSHLTTGDLSIRGTFSDISVSVGDSITFTINNVFTR